MRRLKTLARWLGLTIALGVVAFFVVRNYLVRAIIIQQIRKEYGGQVVVGDWWLNGTSAGLTGVALGETDRPDGPNWVAVDRISTDISIGGLLRGRYLPTRVEVEHPKLALRFDRDGKLATPIPVRVAKGGKGSGRGKSVPIPEVVFSRAELAVAQEGRPPLQIASAAGRLFPAGGKESIEATTDDPVWGKAKVTGQFNPSFSEGSVTLSTAPGFSVDTEEVKKVPFIPAEVWENLAARGPVDATVRINFAANAVPPVHVETRLNLNKVWARLVPLQVETQDTTGAIVIRDATVEVERFQGEAVGGTIRAAGRLDFGQNPPDLDVDLRLKGINVERTPAAWQLNEVGATGTLTGRVGLRVRLSADKIDLTGTSGQALIENGSFQGIPIKELSLNLKATGGDIQFETSEGQAVDRAALESAPVIPTARPLPPPRFANPIRKPGKPGKPGPSVDRLFEPVVAALPLARIVVGDDGFLGFAAFVASEIIEQRTDKNFTPATARLSLPKTITTKIELEDVDLKTILAKAEKFGIKIKFPISGRLTVKATATIPLASLQNLRAYEVHGDANLTAASIDYVDLGELAAHLDVKDGVVNLSDFRGVLVDSPEDDIDHLPQAAAIPGREGPLPVGGFRGDLRAEVEPRGQLSARFRGEQLPLGELFAPFLPVPTPLSGDLSIHTRVNVDLASLTNPRAYTLAGDLESRKVNYKGATLDMVATKFGVKDGHASVSEFSALMADRPMSADVGLDLAPPFAFHARGNVGGWQIANILGFVPNLPPHPEIAGKLDANLDASGTVWPFSIQTLGGARVAAIRLGSFLARYVVFEWRTEQGVVILSGLEAALLDGKITGDARIPTRLGRNLDVNLALKGIDTAAMTQALPSRAVAIAGVADGRLRLSMPLDATTIDADMDLSAPDLSFRPEGRYGSGVKVESLRIQARAHDKLITYGATATSLGAKLRFGGTMPVEAKLARGVARAEAQVVGFRLGEAWRGLGMSGGLAELDGNGSFHANLRAAVEPPEVWLRGLFDLQNLRYGTRLPIGQVSGQVAVTPTAWKLERIDGTLFGGVTTGTASGAMHTGSVGASTFDLQVSRASVPKLLASIPALAKGASGFGTLRASGRLDESLHLSADLTIPQSQVLGLTLTNVRMPADITVSPTSGVGLVQARRWTGRLAGGLLQGNSWMRLGSDRSYQSDLRLEGVDLEVLSRLGAISSKASAGKLTGSVSVNGPDPSNLGKLRGRYHFDITDATLVALPVLRELDRFLGGSRGGGLFDDGEIRGNISNETLDIEQLTLRGRLVQVHAIGSVTFRGGLNLEVLVNTNQTIGQSGSTLVDSVPGLGEVLGKSERLVLKLASFLSSRLLKFRVTGTAQNPTVTLDPSVDVGDSAVGFFSGVLKVPVGG